MLVSKWLVYLYKEPEYFTLMELALVMAKLVQKVLTCRKNHCRLKELDRIHIYII